MRGMGCSDAPHRLSAISTGVVVAETSKGHERGAQVPWQADVDSTVRECLRAIRVQAGEAADGQEGDTPRGSGVGMSTLADVVVKLAEAQAMGVVAGDEGGSGG